MVGNIFQLRRKRRKCPNRPLSLKRVPPNRPVRSLNRRPAVKRKQNEREKRNIRRKKITNERRRKTTKVMKKGKGILQFTAGVWNSLVV